MTPPAPSKRARRVGRFAADPDGPIPWCVVLTETGGVMSQHRTRAEAARFAAHERRNGWKAHVARLRAVGCR